MILIVAEYRPGVGRRKEYHNSATLLPQLEITISMSTHCLVSWYSMNFFHCKRQELNPWINKWNNSEAGKKSNS